MIRLFRGGLIVVLLAVLVAALAGRATAADSPLEGNWLFKEVSNGSNTPLAIIQVEVTDGKPTLKVLSSPLLGKDLKLEGVKVSGSSVSFNFNTPRGPAVVTASAPKGEEKVKVLHGTVLLGPAVVFADLERTELKEVDLTGARKPAPLAQDLMKARFNQKPEEQEKAYKEILEKNAENAAGFAAAEALLGIRVKAGAKDEELGATADAVLKAARTYGPAAESRAVLSVAQALVRAEKVSPLALEYARKAEKGLTKDDPAVAQVAVVKTLVSALNKTGKSAEAKEYAATLTKLETQLDEEFEKTSIPFKPAAPAGRKGKSSRVAVVELFTGAQCPPCVSADIAFDAAAKSYKPADVVFLEYHLHIPGPDPLTNPDTEGRQKYYGSEIQGTPTAFVNGKVTEALGGFKQHGEERYKTLGKIIDGALEDEDKATLKLTAQRSGDKIEAEADVADLKKTGEKVRLRFVLIEDVARYPGSNGQRLHHHVVRAVPGGLNGFEMKEPKATQKVTISIADIKKNLGDYLAKRSFMDDDRPMELKHLKLIAFVQDDENKEILQAAQVDVPEEK
jgi:hypothetical protein